MSNQGKASGTLQGQAKRGTKMRIGSLATASGLSRDTLRFYEERG
jgi:hypothetical protein